MINTSKPRRTLANFLLGAALCLFTACFVGSNAIAQNSDPDDLPDFLKSQKKQENAARKNPQQQQNPPAEKLPMFLTSGSGDAESRPAPNPVQSNVFKPVAIPVARVPQVRPEKAYNGCESKGTDIPAEEVSDAPNPRERMLEAGGGRKVDPLTERTFASFSLDDVADAPDSMDGLCWKRLDGVWRELSEITLDRSKDNGEIWDVEGTELASLTNGNYTTANFLVVAKDGVSDDALYLSSGLGEPRFIEFVSTDDVSLDDALKRGGQRKTYRANEKTGLGQTIAIDVSRSGRIRLILDGRTFLRPAPGVSKAAMNAQVAANDVFLLSYNLENLSASRKGYDVVSQDPFYLLQNPKFDVFAKVDANKYVISEKRTVPLGFTLIKEDIQGNVFRKTLVSSETQYQDTISDAYGASAKISVSGAANTLMAAVPASGSFAETSSGVGFNSTSESMRSMRDKKFVGQSVGYSRTKKYALVVDHPFVTLSDDFLDAIEDARRYGNYQAIIDKFGTHYPYAVTYGANAKMTGKITDEEYETAVREAKGNAVDAQITIMESGINRYMQHNYEKMQNNKGIMGNENSTFVAVGGSGSWDQSGYSSGETPYPILLDLRPIDELLNPLNFPDEPEIYSAVRANLALAVNRYVARKSRPLRDESLLPEVSYTPPAPKKDEPIEEWHIYTRYIDCQDKVKVVNLGVVTGVEGRLSINATGPNGPAGFATPKVLAVKCRDKKQTKTYDYNANGAPGLLIIKGTRAQIKQYQISYEFNWNYKPKIKSRRHNKTYKKTVLQSGLAPNKYRTYRWGIGAKGKSAVNLGITIKRYK